MPSPQKQISQKKPEVDEFSESEGDVEGLLERSYDAVNQLESMLLNEIFDFFAGIAGLLQSVEELGGKALAGKLAANEKLTGKISKFLERREGEDSDDSRGYW